MYFLADKITKVLRLLPSEASHKIALSGLKVAYSLGFSKESQNSDSANRILNLEFPNRVGLAAGMDKNGDYIDSLASLGFGFLEIGTVTPKPQVGNSKPRLFRLKSQSSLINRMGFNNKGVDYVVSKIKKRRSKAIIGVSIGKNFDTPIERAEEDYLECLFKAYEFSDYIALNISSPNTNNLRNLEKPRRLVKLITLIKGAQEQLKKQHGYKPIFLKLSPNTERIKQKELSEVILDMEVDGIICSNTTSNHDFSEQGGLSGKLLFDKATECLSSYRELLGGSFPIIASGGVMGIETYQQKIKAGANLVQIYTGMIYKGPGLIPKLVSIQEKD